MPAVSERRLEHLKKLNALPQTRANGFQKGSKPWNYGTKVMTTLNCQLCGKEFQISQSQLKRETHHSGRFCSKKCFYAFKVKHSLREQIRPLYENGKTYKEIGQELNLPPFTVGSQVYRMKIKDRYGDGINSFTSKKRLRHLLKEYHQVDGCELCGYSRTIEIAHIVETKNGGGHFMDNCIVLCPNCHHLFDHNMLNEDEKKGLRKIARLNGNLERRLERA